MRILIIDDDDIVRELLCSTLKKVGHEVYELETAIGATRMIFEHDIDAVVVDVNLPFMSGDKLARMLRQNSRGQTLGIVLVSSRPLEELKALAIVAQADNVVPKSSIRTGLEPAIMQACQRRVRAARPA
jgi:DNA-binding response OmpR family regulator